MNKILFTLLFMISFSALAEFSYLNRSQQALLMGDAFTAVADDEMTLFYNPAALGRHSGVSLIPIKPNLEFPDIVQKDIGFDGFNMGLDDRFDKWPKDPAQITDRILGFPLYLQIGASPTIKMGSFGLSLFAVSKTNMILENAIHPILDLNYRLDRGVIMGYAFTMGKKPRGKDKSGSGHLSSFGIGVKSMNRQGLEGSYDLFGTELLEIISNSASYKEIRTNLGYSKGSAIGLDLGWEHNYYAGNTRLGFGASLMDVGGTKFHKTEGISDVPDQDMSLNTGMAFEQKFLLLDYTLSADYHNILDPYTPAISKLKLGARLDFPVVELFFGWNGGYTSYGIAVEALFFKFMVGFYGVEIGQKFKQREGERVVISLSLLELHFDQF